jgi:uncharacterized protein (DUF885 family)
MGSGSYLHPFKTLQDYHNFLSRAQGFSAWVDTAIANLRVGIARGIIPPRILMARVPAFFGHLPRTKFEIRATEKFRAASASAEYNAGIADGGPIPAWSRSPVTTSSSR